MDGGRLTSNAESSGARGQRGASAPALDKRLGLRRKAREDAARGLPRADAAELSPTERLILDTLSAERAQLDKSRDQVKADIERRLRALAPSSQDFSGPIAETRLALNQAVGRLAHDWTAASQEAQAARAHLDTFKREHDLRRVAIYPNAPILQTGLLFAAALFEALFSAALFAEDDERGLLGGAVTAIGLSGANVALGFLAGFLGLRYLQHVRLPLKVGGAFAFGALSLLALMLNLFAADWRDRLAETAGRTITNSDASFHLWSLLQLNSPQAIILLMLGAGVWAFAALKGYSGFDDPYPDYGKMDRAARAARDQLSEFRSNARLVLEEPVNAARTALTGRLEKMRGEVEAMTKVFDSAAVKIEAFDSQARALDRAAAEAIWLYRQENLAARTGPAPAYFDAPPPVVAPWTDALTTPAAIMDDARARLQDAQTRFAEALTSLLADLDAATHQLDGEATA
jgi:hypothetical protein